MSLLDEEQKKTNKRVQPSNNGRAHKPTSDNSPAAKTADPSYQFTPLTSAEFAEAVYKLDWLIQSTLVRGMPVIVGGPRKSLKTTILLDLALSLGSGTPFLGKFTAYKPVRTVVLSGESGPWALKETALRICTAKRIQLSDTNTLWGFDLPQLANPVHLAQLRDGLESNDIEVAIIDPLYLALLAGVSAQGLEASNLFDMGPLLLNVAKTCLGVACTPIMAHHSVKHLQTVGDPLELEDLAFAGIQEFARQWLLINRREPFDADAPGSHKLWLSVGGSIGLAKLWAVDVEEGELREDFAGRRWEVSVEAGGESRKAAREAKGNARAEAKERNIRNDGTALLSYLDAHDKERAGLGWSRTRAGLGWDSSRMGRTIQPLLDIGIVENCDFVVPCGAGKKTVKGIRRKPVQSSQQETTGGTVGGSLPL